MKKIHQEIADAYNQHGRMYHESRVKKGRAFNEFLEVPATWSLMPVDLHNLSVLDAGCGSGLYAKKLAEKGANVLGLDISETMIAIANEENTYPEKITYKVGDLSEIECQDKSMDIIISNYVLENIIDIENIFQEFHRILKPGGICIYSISHPIRATSTAMEVNGQEVWQLENYYDKGIRTSDFGNGMKVKKYKRTISDYINPAIAAGFSIKEFCEPQPIPEAKEHDAKTYDLATRLPQVLLIKMTA